MIIDDVNQANKTLSIISYFRLASYWRPMEEKGQAHQFKPNSHFNNALSLYYFDKELRALIFSAIQSIEIALRTKVIHSFSIMYGPFWFMDDTLVKSLKQQQENIASLRKELDRSKEDFIQEHYRKYDFQYPFQIDIWYERQELVGCPSERANHRARDGEKYGNASNGASVDDASATAYTSLSSLLGYHGR